LNVVEWKWFELNTQQQKDKVSHAIRDASKDLKKLPKQMEPDPPAEVSEAATAAAGTGLLPFPQKVWIHQSSHFPVHVVKWPDLQIHAQNKQNRTAWQGTVTTIS
jgi:hypothetical protein